jgi:ABC-type glycerol-3-phosphate transport system permease component
MSLADARSDVELDDLLYGSLKFITWTVLVAMTLLPFLYAFFVSFRPQEELVSSPHWIPRDVTLRWWQEAITTLDTFIWNSLVVATGTAIISLAITIPSAYAFGRREFPGRGSTRSGPCTIRVKRRVVSAAGEKY